MLIGLPLKGNGEPLEVLNRRLESLDLCFRKIILVSSVEAMDQREKNIGGEGTVRKLSG